MANKFDEFYSATISGAEIECKFSMSKAYFTGKPEDRYKEVYFDIGFLEEVGWRQSNSASAKYNLTSIKPIDIYAGMEITEGSLAFKVFHHDSFEELKRVMIDGLNGGKDKLVFSEIYDSPFLSLDEEWEDWEFHSDHKEVLWSQMPLMKIHLIAKNKNANNELEVRKKTISGVIITNQGMAVSTESVEMTASASFMAIGGISDWELYGGDI